MLLGNFETIVSYFADAAVETLGYGLEGPCPFEAFIRKTRINVNDYFSHNMKKFGYWGMMSLALSRFEFSNDKFTVYLAVPPFIPKASATDDSFFPDHLFLFGLEPYSSEVYNDQLKTLLAQTEEYLQGIGSFDKELILSNCGRVLQRQKRSRPLQFNVMPMPSTSSPDPHTRRKFQRLHHLWSAR